MVPTTVLLYNYFVGPSREVRFYRQNLGKPRICPRPFESPTCPTEPYTELDPFQVAYAPSRLKWEMLGVMEIKALGVRCGSGDTVRLE